MKILFDTTILIDAGRKFAPAVNLIKKVAKKEIDSYISGITEGEILSGKECKNLNKLRETTDMLLLFTKIEITNEILQKAAEFRRNYDVGLLDAIIAATAFYERCKLWTKNIEDFRKIKEIEVEEPY